MPPLVQMPAQNLLRFFTAADVDDEDRVGNNFFLQIRKLRFGHKSKLCSDFEHKVWILRLKFSQDLKRELPERKTRSCEMNIAL